MEQFDFLVNSDIPIQVNILDSDPMGGDRYGSNVIDALMYTDGSVKVISSKIFLYNDKINEFAEEYGISPFSSKAGTFAHQIEHARDQNTKQANEYWQAVRDNRENVLPDQLQPHELEPRKIKKQVIKEIEEEMNNVNEMYDEMEDF